MALPAGWRIGVVQPQLYPQILTGEGPVVETAAAIAADSQLSILEVGHVRDELTRARLKVLLSTGGLRAAFNAAPSIVRHGWNPSAEDAAVRAEALTGLTGLLNEAHFLGARLFTLVSGADPGAAGRAAAKAALTETLQKLCDTAGPLGIQVSLETCDRDVDQKRLIGPTTEACDLVKAAKRDNLGLTLDLAHLLLLKENPLDAISNARNYLLHAQISNCVLAENHPARGDQHPAFGTEGSLAGVEQVAQFLKGLDKYGFWKKSGGGWLTIEVRPRDEEYSSVVLAGALRVINEAAATL